MRKIAACVAIMGILLYGIAISENARHSQPAPIRLSELMASNNGSLFDADGGTPDWIEIYNSSDKEEDLTGLSLSNDEDDLSRFTFGDLRIPAGGYLLVYCTGEAAAGSELNTPFKLGASGESVFLSFQGEILDSIGFERQSADISLALDASGTWRESAYPTPGSENAFPEGSTGSVARDAISISEVMASASRFRSDRGYDWIELRNTSSQSVKAGGYTLTLGYFGGKCYTLPAGTTIAAGGYLLVYFTENTIAKVLSSGFSLPAQNSIIVLYNDSGIPVDAAKLGVQYGNISYGRITGSDRFLYLEEDTPRKENQVKGYAARASKPVLGLDGGFYGSPVTVSLKSEDGTRIYYTTDGSVPTERSRLYTTPLVFTKTAILRAVALSDTLLASVPASATYFVGFEIAAPVVSLMTDDLFLFDSSSGVMVNGGGITPNYENEWEYPMQIEYYDEGGISRLNQMCGFSVSGEVSRKYSQKAMAFFARSAYGSDTFEFNPFPNRDFTSYKTFTLRAAGTEGVSDGVRFRDAMLTSLALGTNTLVSDARPVLVYLNGRIWGHYNLRERINKYSVAQHENVTEPDVIDAIDLLAASGAVKNGSSKDYKELSAFMKRSDLNDPEAMRYVLDRMDVDSYFDYAAFMMMTGNYDVSNAKFYRIPGGKWKWSLYDLDAAMYTPDSKNPINVFLSPTSAAIKNDFDHVPFSALMKVPDMKDKFLTRLGQLMAEQFTAAFLTERIEEWRMKLQPIIPYHVLQWKFLTLKSWNANVDHFLIKCRERPENVVKNAKTLFKLSDGDVTKYFGAFLIANRDE